MGRRQARNRSPRASPSTLDARAREAIARSVRVLARCGCKPEHIAQEVLKACRRIPRSWARTATAAVSEMDAAAHVLTLWFQDPLYLDSSGNPKPLPLRGAARSLEALARRVNPKLDVEKILAHLLRRSVLRRIGSRYLPRNRALIFRGSGAPYHARSIQTMVSMLSTLEHNSRPGRSTPGWFERFAANARVPVSAIPAFDRWLLRHRFLEQADAKLHAYERRRRKGERTVRIGVGLYRFGEERPLPQRRTRRRIPRRKWD
jgi:Family of unknown function (DUF6502)